MKSIFAVLFSSTSMFGQSASSALIAHVWTSIVWWPGRFHSTLNLVLKINFSHSSNYHHQLEPLHAPINANEHVHMMSFRVDPTRAQWKQKQQPTRVANIYTKLYQIQIWAHVGTTRIRHWDKTEQQLEIYGSAVKLFLIRFLHERILFMDPHASYSIKAANWIVACSRDCNRCQPRPASFTLQHIERRVDKNGKEDYFVAFCHSCRIIIVACRRRVWAHLNKQNPLSENKFPTVLRCAIV